MSTKPVAHQVMPGARDAESATAGQGAVRNRDSLFHWSGTVDAIQQTTDPSDKRALLDAYFEAVAVETVKPAASFFTGTLLPRSEGRPGRVDPTVVAEAIRNLSGLHAEDIRTRLAVSGDLGVVAADAFAGRIPSGVPVAEVAAWGSDLSAAVGTPAEATLVREMLARVSSLEARYLVSLMLGKLDIGVDAASVDEAVATRLSSAASSRRGDRRQHDVPRDDQPQRRRR